MGKEYLANYTEKNLTNFLKTEVLRIVYGRNKPRAPPQQPQANHSMGTEDQ
jgi:hypothetical protein